MKYIIIFCTSLLISILTYGQKKTESLAIVAYWGLGETYNYKISKIVQQYKEGKLTKNEINEYSARFEVIDSTESSYKIKWSYSFNFKNILNIINENNNLLSDKDSIVIIYETDELGQFSGIINWHELSVKMTNMFDHLIVNLSKNDPIKRRQISEKLKPFLEVYQSKNGLEQLIYKEIQYFHFPFGLEFSTKKTIKWEENIPNMFGGKEIKGIGKLYFKKIDTENSRCVMISEIEMDSKDTQRMIMEVLEKLGLNENQRKKEFKNSKIQMNDYNVFEYYYFPGLPIRIETNRLTEMRIAGEEGKRIEQIKIELLN